MLDLKLIRQKPDFVKDGMRKRGVDANIIDRILKLDEERRTLVAQVDNLKRERNRIQKDERLRTVSLSILKELKEKINNTKEILKEKEKELQSLLFSLPNIPSMECPIGSGEENYEIVKVVSKPKKFKFKAKSYLDLAKDLDLIDIERAAKVSGSRFAYLKNELVLLELGIIRFGIDVLIKNGFSLVLSPVLITEKAMRGMGYLDKGKEEIYHLEKDNLFLVGTSEQALGPMHMGEVFEEKELPKRYAGLSSCFRREAGSYGKDVKGIMRVHQFDKLEMFSFVLPEHSRQEHEFFLELEEKFMKALKLPYRVVKVSSADMSFPTSFQYDIETFIPSEGRYRETHSTSNTTDFQARRLNIRYRKESKNKNLAYVHMINGTFVAIPRIIIAILENYQNKDGSIDVPQALVKYVGLKKIRRQK